MYNFKKVSYSEKKLKKPLNWNVLIATASGNTLEWFNFIAFVFLSSTISQLFFPGDNPNIALIKVFGIYALGFAARPIGGIIFGYIGDHIGRRTNLIASIVLMTLSTLLMGLLPTYEQVGVTAPLLLVLLRTLQGISVGGEYTGAAVYIYEHAPKNQKGFWVSFMPMTIAIGILLGSAVSLVFVQFLTTEALVSYGWRLIFFIGTLFGIIIFWLRLKLIETPSFKRIKQECQEVKTSLIKTILTQHWRNSLILFFIVTFYGIKYQILFIWMPTFLNTTDRLSNSTALVLNTISMVVFVLLVPIMGYFSDKINKERLIKITLVIDILITYPLFLVITHYDLPFILAALLLMSITFAIINVLATIVMMDFFPVNIRVSAISLAYNLAFAIFGGTAPLIATWFIYATNNHAAPAYILILSAAASLIAMWLLRYAKRYP